MEANTNPALEVGFCTTGTTIDIPEQLQLLGVTPENPTIHGHVINKLFNMIFENLNHQKKKGISFWESDEEYEATSNNIDICRRNNKIYFCKQSHNDTGDTPKDPATNPDYWTVLYDLDKPLFDEFNKYALKNGSNQNLFKVKNAVADDEAVAKKQLEDILASFDTMPTGSVITYPVNNIPDGFLECNGAELSRTTYAGLFSSIGVAYGVGDGTTTFKIPDLRGEFIRGFDNGRGVDSGRTVGSWQEDIFKSHNHTFDGYFLTGSSGGYGWHPGASNNSAIGYTGGTETRPRNIAMMYCIKY